MQVNSMDGIYEENKDTVILVACYLWNSSSLNTSCHYKIKKMHVLKINIEF